MPERIDSFRVWSGQFEQTDAPPPRHRPHSALPELAGNEEPFPGPDNQSKMKRSCDGAEQPVKVETRLRG
ncbi:hypothetical protein QBC40DRAFT_254463 [Triangularia verruculosa]|uniref:Uncharacterized protein n=1 Tax=Triangularia verruculosa TaxID=2587418 RepID=A0AAN6XLP5_9PEZI|nr:hypothetical protein QBC40DRAFT_254463 [Triangularia verruculosa]